MAVPSIDWQNRVKVLLRTELVRRGISQRELVERLANIGVKETEKGLSNKLIRGSFSAAFMIACLDAVGCRTLNLNEDETR
jgi:hypothetical protein